MLSKKLVHNRVRIIFIDSNVNQILKLQGYIVTNGRILFQIEQIIFTTQTHLTVERKLKEINQKNVNTKFKMSQLLLEMISEDVSSNNAPAEIILP